ncbi:hypothetical protein RB628_26340 [Streptomyces sp. ADMS]|nr:hypothetical protein [Streptomyces sp. ADMS]MDW4908762.1 hypothetical protein [Streptomyces sp. ADMS]
MNHVHVLCGLAANTALPSELVDRLIEVAVADVDFVDDLADRADLSRAQALALYARVPETGVPLGRDGRLNAADVDPAADPETALVLLDEGLGDPGWARLFPGALLEDLTRHRPPVKKAFREIARHRNATPRALLACLTDDEARSIAAGHPALPPPAVVELLDDDNRQVVEAAAGNPSLPRAVMLKLVP